MLRSASGRAGRLLSLIDLPTSPARASLALRRSGLDCKILQSLKSELIKMIAVVDFTGSYFKEFPLNFHENESSIDFGYYAVTRVYFANNLLVLSFKAPRQCNAIF